MRRPAPDEAAPYYWRYIDRVAGDDVMGALADIIAGHEAHHVAVLKERYS